jgi:8-oxo-dGTP diphosphatase
MTSNRTGSGGLTRSEVGALPLGRTRYVAGFLIAPDDDRVLLIRKTHPEWQAGKLNGIGGKIDPGESPLEAMVREFKEEAGLVITGWQHFLTLNANPNGRVYFFRCFAPFGVLCKAKTQTDEWVGHWSIGDATLPYRFDMIPNLRWILPLAAHQHDTYAPINAVELSQ